MSICLDRHASETPDGLRQQRDEQDDPPAEREGTTKLEATTEETPSPTEKTRSGDEQLNVIV